MLQLLPLNCSHAGLAILMILLLLHLSALAFAPLNSEFVSRKGEEWSHPCHQTPTIAYKWWWCFAWNYVVCNYGSSLKTCELMSR